MSDSRKLEKKVLSRRGRRAKHEMNSHKKSLRVGKDHRFRRGKEIRNFENSVEKREKKRTFSSSNFFSLFLFSLQLKHYFSFSNLFSCVRFFTARKNDSPPIIHYLFLFVSYFFTVFSFLSSLYLKTNYFVVIP